MKKSKILWITLLGIGVVVAISVIIILTTKKPILSPTTKKSVAESATDSTNKSTTSTTPDKIKPPTPDKNTIIKPVPIPEEVETPAEVEAPAPEETTTPEKSSKKETYQTDAYSITLPASWQGKYSVVTGENEDIGLYSTANKDAGYGGYVAGISVFSAYDQWNEEGFIDSPIYLGANKDKTKFYVIGGPTDVNFNYNDSDLATEYKAMSKDIPEIASSFKLLP